MALIDVAMYLHTSSPFISFFFINVVVLNNRCVTFCSMYKCLSVHFRSISTSYVDYAIGARQTISICYMISLGTKNFPIPRDTQEML